MSPKSPTAPRQESTEVRLEPHSTTVLHPASPCVRGTARAFELMAGIYSPLDCNKASWEADPRCKSGLLGSIRKAYRCCAAGLLQCPAPGRTSSTKGSASACLTSTLPALHLHGTASCWHCALPETQKSQPDELTIAPGFRDALTRLFAVCSVRLHGGFCRSREDEEA